MRAPVQQWFIYTYLCFTCTFIIFTSCNILTVAADLETEVYWSSRTLGGSCVFQRDLHPLATHLLVDQLSVAMQCKQASCFCLHFWFKAPLSWQVFEQCLKNYIKNYQISIWYYFMHMFGITYAKTVRNYKYLTLRGRKSDQMHLFVL